MNRSIAIVGAPSSIGIRSYDNGEAPAAGSSPILRELGVVQRLGASDLGNVIPPAYRDYVPRGSLYFPPHAKHLGELCSKALGLTRTRLRRELNSEE